MDVVLGTAGPITDRADLVRYVRRPREDLHRGGTQRVVRTSLVVVEGEVLQRAEPGPEQLFLGVPVNLAEVARSELAEVRKPIACVPSVEGSGKVRVRPHRVLGVQLLVERLGLGERVDGITCGFPNDGSILK
jgi:hypothetical protein